MKTPKLLTYSPLLVTSILLSPAASGAMIFSENFESGWADGEAWFNSTTSVNGWSGQSSDNDIPVHTAPALANAPSLGSFYTDFNGGSDGVVTISNEAGITTSMATQFVMEWDMSALSFGGTDGAIHYFGFTDDLTSNNINGNMYASIRTGMDATQWYLGINDGGVTFGLGEWARLRLSIDTATDAVSGEYNAYDSNGALTTWEAIDSGVFENGTGNSPLAGIAFGHRDTGLTTAATTQSQIGIDNIVVTSVPEPSVAGLAALGLLGLFVRKRVSS